MLDLIKILLDLILSDIEEKLKGTPIEPYTNYIFWGIIAVLGIVICVMIIRILNPLWKLIKKTYDRYSRRKFIKNKIYGDLSFMESSDVFYAIEQFIPTRFSLNNDAVNDDEPSPDYPDSDQDKGRLLIERFCKYEFDIKTGRKYYLCLADCGMGKTTFLINLYFQITKMGKNHCKFISLQDGNCLNEIASIPEKSKTILLLDALDENAKALANYTEFAEELEGKICDFYRVVITSRTNFFESESKEKLSNHKRINGISSKGIEMRKFYITPFTDDDIKRYLRLRYRWNRKKQKNAWQLIKRNKNLSVRPMLLRFMDEVLSENQVFEYDFQLYECLFQKWIERERSNYNAESTKALYSECINLAKVIYYQWRKSGQIGVLQEELADYSISGLGNIQIKGHAILNRTNDGIYKFSHRSYWEYMLAKLALSDPFFACELFIKNFDRAESFFEEMRQYYRTHSEELTLEANMGIADYILKYDRVEEAEIYYQNIIKKKSENTALNLLAMIHMVKCFQRQLKFKSAANLLKKCLESIADIPLNEGTLPLYIQFGNAYVDYCNMTHIKDGQIFIDNVINFCNKENITGYAILCCYELYCRCSINYYYQQQAMASMESLLTDKFSDDQYAMYLHSCTRIQCMDSQSPETFPILVNIINNGRIFMDSFEQIQWYGKLVVSSAVVGEWNNVSVKCLEDSHYISETIYGETINPYSATIYQNIIAAYRLFTFKPQQLPLSIYDQCIQYITGYIEKKCLQEEIDTTQFIGDSYNENDISPIHCTKEAAEKKLEAAYMINNIYDIINAHLLCYRLYNNNAKTKKRAQTHLEAAYAKSQNQDALDFRETSAYCNLLQTIIHCNEGGMDRDYIAKRLLEATPEIYGYDKRAADIYMTLQKYFEGKNDGLEKKACSEWLYLDFDYYKLIYFYNSCEKCNQPEDFIKTLEALLVHKGIFSEIEELDIERFWREKRKDLRIDIDTKLNNLLKQNRNLRERNQRKISYIH